MHSPLEIKPVQNIQVSATQKFWWNQCLSTVKYRNWNDQVAILHILSDAIKALSPDHSYIMWLLRRFKYIQLNAADYIVVVSFIAKEKELPRENHLPATSHGQT